MPNGNVLPSVVEKLQIQVTRDAPLREAWFQEAKKHHRNLTTLRSRLTSESARLIRPVDAIALKWAHTGKLPQPHQDAELEMQIAFLRERIHRAHIFTKWLEASGCQIHGKTDQEILIWLLTDFWKLYGQTAWLETIASSV